MRKVYSSMRMIFVLCCIFSITGVCLAQEKATKEECVAKVKEAAALVKQIGLEATLQRINDPNGGFRWKDTYVFCYRLDGTMLAFNNPKLVGKNLIGLKDTTGKMYVAEFMSVAKSPAGEGWVTYTWPKPGEQNASPKITYVYRVPGENVAMFAGIYE